MATVRRANVILDIPDAEDIIQQYLDKGYSLIDPVTGAVIKRAMPHEIGALQALVLEKDREIEELREQIKVLSEKPKRSKKSEQK